MSSRAEKENELAAKRSEHSQCKARIKNYNAKISRLKKVKSTLSSKKSEFGKTRTQTQKIFKKDYEWCGENYDKIIDVGNEMDIQNVNYKDVILDNALDSLNDEITRLENLVNDEKGLLGKLMSLINSISNEIENMVN